MSELDPAEAARRRARARRNVALFWALLAFVAMVFFVTIARLKGAS